MGHLASIVLISCVFILNQACTKKEEVPVDPCVEIKPGYYVSDVERISKGSLLKKEIVGMAHLLTYEINSQKFVLTVNPISNEVLALKCGDEPKPRWSKI